MIYFAAERGTNFVKIGYCRESLSGRLAALQTGNPRELRIVASCDGSPATEFDFHKRFAMNRVRGEWFTITKEIAEVIEKFSIAIVEPTEDTEQTVDLERERLNAFVFPYVVRQVKIAAATRGVTLGEVIEELVIRHLPPVPGPEAAR